MLRHKELLLRLAVYTSIAVAYFTFMSDRAPLGISPLDFQIERVYNASWNILSNWPFNIVGLSSWDQYQANSIRYYFVQAVSYLHYVIFAAGGKESVKAAMTILDPTTITLSAVFIAEIYRSLIGRTNRSTEQLSAIACFIIFITSVYSYRMAIAMWHDVLFLLWATLAALLATQIK